MATISDIALFGNIAKGIQQSQSDFAKASAAKDKLESDKERNKLDFDIKKLQIQKAEFGLSPEQQAFATKKAKLDLDFTQSQIDKNIAGADLNKARAQRQAGGLFASLKNAQGRVVDGNGQDFGQQLIRGGVVPSGVTLTERETAQGDILQSISKRGKKDIFGSLSEREAFRKAGRRQALLDTGKDGQDLTEEDIRAGILKREGQLGITQGSFFEAERNAQQQFGAQQQIGSAEQELNLESPKIKSIVDSLRASGESEEAIKRQLTEAIARNKARGS